MTQALDHYIPGIHSLPLSQQTEWNQFFAEAVDLMKHADIQLLKEWGRGSLSIAVQTTVSRANALRRMVRAVAHGIWEEFKLLFLAITRGELSKYAQDACKRAWQFLTRVWARIKSGIEEVHELVRRLPHVNRNELLEYGASLLGGVIGFALIGGAGDGGIIDMDIAVAGIGGHRSIFFHSVFIGLAAEVCFLSTFRLLELLYERVPRKHSPIWDRLMVVSRRFNQSLITGTWIGVTTHLSIDSHIDGWTPYKDLPVALPNWGHHMLMDFNAAASGWFGWQWHDKVKRRFRSHDFAPPRSDGNDLKPLAAENGANEKSVVCRG